MKTLAKITTKAYLAGGSVALSTCLVSLLALLLGGVSPGLILWGGPVLLGCATGFASFLIVARKSGLYFATIGGGGKSLVFSNANYQREFDRMN